MNPMTRTMGVLAVLMAMTARAAEPASLTPTGAFEDAQAQRDATVEAKLRQASAGTTMQVVGGLAAGAAGFATVVGLAMVVTAPFVGVMDVANDVANSRSASGSVNHSVSILDAGAGLALTGLIVGAVGLAVAASGTLVHATADASLRDLRENERLARAERQAEAELARRAAVLRAQHSDDPQGAPDAVLPEATAIVPGLGHDADDPAYTPAPVGSLRAHTRPPLRVPSDAPTR